MNDITTQVTTFDTQRTTLREELDGLESEKSKIMGEANDYNQAKSALDLEISDAMKQYEIDNTAIVASQNRLERIDIRLPEIKTELEAIENSRSGIVLEIQKIQNSLSEINEKKNNIAKNVENTNSQRNKVLAEQSEAAAKKSEIDEKLEHLENN